MSEGYFSGEAQVLLANGGYRNISKLKPGEFVLNMRMEPVKVLKVRQGPKKVMCEVRHHNWYAPFYCTPEMQLLTLENVENEPEIAEMKWTNVSSLKSGTMLSSENGVYQKVLPDTFSVPITTPTKVLMLQPSYKLGLLLGLYSGYGTIVKDTIEFRFGPNDALVEQVSTLLSEIFDADAFIEKDEYCYQVRCNCDYLKDILVEFGTKLNRTIPRQYWSKHDEYVSGLFEGLVEFDPENNVSRYIPVSSQMAEVFLWTCTLLGLTFENDTPRTDQCAMRVYPLFVKHKQDDSHLGIVTGVNKTELKLAGWNLVVECSTQSYVVNNMVVRAVTPTEEELAEEAEKAEETIAELTNEPVPDTVEGKQEVSDEDLD